MQHSEPRGWWPKLPKKQDTLSWTEMLVEPPKVHATLCENSCADDCPDLCLDVLPKDIGSLANNARFLNSLITQRIASLDVPVVSGDEYALRKFCLSVFSRNPTIVLRLKPSSEKDEKVVQYLASIWPDHIVLGQSPLPGVAEHGRTANETGLVDQQPSIPMLSNADSHAAGPKPNKGGTADRAMAAMCTLGNGASGIAISRDWVMGLPSSARGASVTSPSLGYSLYRRAETSHPLKHWVPCRTSADALQPQQALFSVSLGPDGPRRTKALRFVEEKQGYFRLSVNADEVCVGDFVLDAAGCLLGLVTGHQSPTVEGATPVIFEALSMTRIWEDLCARADLGNSSACQALSDLTYIRDLANKAKPSRMRRHSLGRVAKSSPHNRQQPARRA